MQPLLNWAWGLALLLHATTGRGGELPVTAFNSYMYPPFLQEDGRGLASELVDYLNRELSGEFHLTLENVPRQRLVKVHLIQGAKFGGIALFLSPQFVDDAERKHFLWSKPVFDDYNVLVFRGRTPPNIKSLSELKGKTFAAILGTRNARLDEMVAAGQLSRTDSYSEKDNLKIVRLGRVDFTSMNRLMYRELVKDPELADGLVAIPEPGSQPFSRRILIGHAQSDLAKKIDAAIARMHCDKRWIAVATKYGISLAHCP